jgi:hypothetical protein
VSKIADDVYDILKISFPFTYIEKEHYVNYRNTKLLFDFYVRSLGILIECQGRQHTEFVKHFHGQVDNFYSQKRRDNLKVEYCEENDLTLVCFYDTIDTITSDLILKRIYEALDV